jgi:hypothetical protein
MSTPPRATPRRITGKGRHPSKIIALIVGVLYTVFGLAGFAVTGLDAFASPDGDMLGPFEVNPLQNLMHLAIGVSSLAIYPRLHAYRIWGWVVFAILGPLAVWGFAAVGMPDTNYLALNAPVNVVHGLTAVAAIAVALWPKRYLTRTMTKRRQHPSAAPPAHAGQHRQGRAQVGSDQQD